MHGGTPPSVLAPIAHGPVLYIQSLAKLRIEIKGGLKSCLNRGREKWKKKRFLLALR
jgi:hypothetical protein